MNFSSRSCKNILIISSLYLLSVFNTFANQHGRDADSVTLYLRWNPQFQFAGYYMALEKGFYEREGLHVSIDHYDGQHPVCQKLANDQAEYGSELAGLILTSPHQEALTVTAAVYQRSPVILLTIDPAIESLQDLQGKKVSGFTEVDAMLRSAGIRETVELEKRLTPVDMLLSGEYDAIGAHIADQPWALDKRGINHKVFKPEDYAIGFYGECLLTSRHEAETYPERVEKFTRASMLGWKYAMTHPEEVVELIKRKYPGKKTKDDLLIEFQIHRNLILPDLFEIGSMSKDRWITMANILAGLGLRDSELDLNTFLFTPDDTTWWEKWGWILMLLVVLALVLISILLLFNYNLRKAVAHRTQKLKKANNELDNLVYSLSHDIRAPLASIQGLISLYKNEKQEEYLGLIEKSVTHLDVFLKEILDHSKNIRTEIKATAIDISSLIENVYAELQYQKGYEKVKLIKELDLSTAVISDQRRMTILLRNFISNAIKYHDSRKAQPFVKVAFTSDETQLTLKIQDNGLGIYPEHLTKIYDVFYQATDHVAGAGLGLYIIKETIESMDGEIKVNSAPNEGTTFTVVLPNLSSSHIKN